MKFLHELDTLIANKIKSNARKSIQFFIITIIAFTIISIAEMMSIGETPDITNPGVILLIVVTELLCYLAIWTYIKKLLSRSS